MRMPRKQFLGVLLGLMVTGAVSAACHEGVITLCQAEKADCLSNPPPGVFPDAFCEARYRACLADHGCSS